MSNSKPTDSQLLELLYKKFLGVPNGKVGESYSSELPLFARQRIIPIKQIYAQPIPQNNIPAFISPVDYTVNSNLTNSTSTSNFWDGDQITEYGSKSTMSGYPHIVKYTNVPLVLTGAYRKQGDIHYVSYYLKSSTNGINYFDNQIPYNFDLINGTYSVSITIHKRNLIRIGKILSAEKVEGSDKLLKLMVDFGELDTSNPPTPKATAWRRKIYPEYFLLVSSGKKKFELRLNDFEIKEGDTIILEEWDPTTQKYTVRTIEKKA
jgi:tRNA-binding EMAP/Myf-like protein